MTDMPELTAPVLVIGASSLDIKGRALEPLIDGTSNKGLVRSCLGGVGRTGTVVGCWLARHGTVGAAALERLTQLRQDTDNVGWASPETEEQVEMVLSWKD